MIFSTLFLLSLLLVSSPLRASPVPTPRQVSNNVSISTPLGPASGVADTSTVARFAVRYASANRWQNSVMATTWALPNNATDPSALPLACPQPSSPENSQDIDEDCLSMLLYVPEVAATSKVPTLMWIHGGSFIVGSATGPGLDGSALAQATGSIIAVVQYRLGAFGFLAPSGESNLAVRDMITALSFLQKVLPSFNGDTSKVTIAGQSSGATMVRALLASPSAASLFKSAILQSDPMDYGFLSPGTFQTLNNFLVSQLPCDASDTSCLDSISTADVLDMSLEVFGAASGLDSSAGAFEPMRPVHDGSLITSPLDSTAPFPKVSKTIIVSTVQDEAGPAIYGQNPDPVPESQWPGMVDATLGEPRTSVIINSTFYEMPKLNATAAAAFDARTQLQTLGTDQIWRCASWSFARNWAASGGKVFVGHYTVGATYPDNEGVDFCTQQGSVCHEDDIQIVFGTVSSPSTAQKNLIAEIQARYKSFLSAGVPNASGYAYWPAVSGGNVEAINLGSSGTAAIAACEVSFWGQEVPFDYQVFGQ